MLNYIESQPGETVNVPSEWDSQPQTDTTNPTDHVQQTLPNGLLVWQKDDPRLHGVNKRLIRTYLQDKIPCAEFDELMRLGNEKGSLQKWRDALVDYAHTHSDDVIHVPNEWKNVKAPKKTNCGITSEMNLTGCNVIKVYFDLESTGYVRRPHTLTHDACTTMHTSTQSHTYTSTHIQSYTRTHIHRYRNTQQHMHTYAYPLTSLGNAWAKTRDPLSVYTHTHTHTQTHTVHIHIYAHIYIHIHIHTYTWTHIK